MVKEEEMSWKDSRSASPDEPALVLGSYLLFQYIIILSTLSVKIGMY